MKILIAKQKYSNLYFDISTKEKESEAYYVLFQYNDQCNVFYDSEYNAIYNLARAGDKQEAKRIINDRCILEYEHIEIVNLIDPLDKKYIENDLGIEIE